MARRKKRKELQEIVSEERYGNPLLLARSHGTPIHAVVA